MTDSNSRLVYSTESGRIDEPRAVVERPKGDGVVRIQRQTSGRKGKGVCLIAGIDLDDDALTKRIHWPELDEDLCFEGLFADAGIYKPSNAEDTIYYQA